MRTVDAGVGGGYTRGCVIEIPIPPGTFAEDGLDALMGEEEAETPMADDDPGDLSGLAEADDSPDDA